MGTTLLFSAALLTVIGMEISLTNALNSNVISSDDKDILNRVYATFNPVFDREKLEGSKQFAVLYYGPGDFTKIFTDDCIKYTNGVIYLLHKALYNYDYDKCPYYIAARIFKSDQHTEKTLFNSLVKEANRFKENYIKCPPVTSKSGNIYLFTYNSPCARCCNTYILKFAKYCRNKFKNLIIGYVQGIQDKQDKESKYSQETINSIQEAHGEIERSVNIAMTAIPELSPNQQRFD